MNPLDEYSPMVEEMKQMMQVNTVQSTRDIKEQSTMKRPLHTDKKIATLTECEESYAKGYEDGRKAGHEAGYKAAHEAISNIIMRVLEEIKP